MGNKIIMQYQYIPNMLMESVNTCKKKHCLNYHVNDLVFQPPKYKWSKNLVKAVDDQKILLLGQQGLLMTSRTNNVKVS